VASLRRDQDDGAGLLIVPNKPYAQPRISVIVYLRQAPLRNSCAYLSLIESQRRNRLVS
jgi:hypothetical protein